MENIIVFIPLIFSQIISKIFSMDKQWLDSLKSSDLTPPGWVFPIVWTILYLMIGYSLTLENNQWLIINLFLNYFWLYAFNYRKDTKLGVITLLLLLLTGGIYFYQTSNLLILPYLIWLSLATYLNGYIYLNN